MFHLGFYTSIPVEEMWPGRPVIGGERAGKVYLFVCL